MDLDMPSHAQDKIAGSDIGVCNQRHNLL